MTCIHGITKDVCIFCKDKKQEEDWDEVSLKEMHQAIEGSAFFLSIYSQKYKEDPTALVQLVFAIMCEKPIYILAKRGEKVPRGFIKAADGIEYYENESDLQRAVTKLARENLTQ